MRNFSIIETLESRRFLSASITEHTCPMDVESESAAPTTQLTTLFNAGSSKAAPMKSASLRTMKRAQGIATTLSNVTGTYKGSIKSSFLTGTVKANLNITSQSPAGVIKGKLSIPNVGVANFTGKGKLNPNGTFTVTFNKSGVSVVLNGKRKANGNLSGTFTATNIPQVPIPLTGTFNFTKLTQAATALAATHAAALGATFGTVAAPLQFVFSDAQRPLGAAVYFPLYSGSSTDANRRSRPSAMKTTESRTPMASTATLIYGDKKIELPIIEGSEGEKAIDITKLRAQTGLITLDPSYGNTGACTSAITFIDGETGILRYRGVPIEQLAERSNFIETAWLLIFGRLPKIDEALRFRRRIIENAHIHESLRHHYAGLPMNAPPMAILSAMINTLGCFYPEFVEPHDEEGFETAAAHLVSKVRTIAAYSYRMSRGLPFIYPDSKLRYVGNLLHMMFSTPYEQYVVDPEIENALNMILLLHADHEQNCSTSTVRLVGSSHANLFSSVASGVCALWGPLHGGANAAVLEMLEEIHKGGLSAEDAINKAKDKNSGFKLMGFGHRVYKNFDPRAKIIKSACDRVLAKVGIHDPLLDIAMKLEELALKDPYFVERKLYPNVDFYSGIIMKAIGIPVNMFTVLFAIGRMPGWIAQWKEQHSDPDTRIARPRQIYIGPRKTDFVPADQRS